MNYEVIIQPEAERDLLDVYEFIARDSHSAAGKWIERLEEAANSLSKFPNRCSIAPENDQFENEIRHLLVGNYRIIFTVMEEERRVHVLHFRHGARLELNSDSPNE